MLRLGKGLYVSEVDCRKLAVTLKLFGKNERLTVDGDYVNFNQTLLVRGKKQAVVVGRELLSDIYPKIEKVFDDSNICIASRLNEQHPLMSSGKGRGKKYYPVTPQEVYGQL